MMKTVSLSLLLLLLLLLSSTAIHPSHAATDSQLNSLCSETINPPVCVKALKSDPRTATANMHGLLLVSIEITRSKASDIFTFLGSARKKSSDQELKRRLGTCYLNYARAVNLLTEAKGRLRVKDYVGVEIRASDAMEKSEVCEDGFEAGPPKVDELKPMNDEMQNLCSIVFALVRKR